MVWSQNHFPSAMRSLSPSVRTKAIEIANALQERGGLAQEEVISTSIYEARSWARRRYSELESFNAARPSLQSDY